jgi:hypothetical protein
MVAVCYVHPGVLLIKPTSLMRGKGLIAGLWGVVGRELRCRGRMWWWRNETNINRDAVDVGFKLRSPSMITFDMNAFRSDSKIKNIGI